MQSKRNLVLLGCCLGLFETTSQVVLLRELYIAFTGNELTIATVLALWLVSVSLGSLAAGRSLKPRAIHSAVATLFIMAGAFSLFQVILIRIARPALAPAGELMSPALTVALAALGVAPCAALLGALFIGLVRLGRESSCPSPLPAVYGGEALGSGIGGAALSFWLLEAANPVAITALAAILAAAAAMLCLRGAPAGRRGHRIIATAAFMLAAVFITVRAPDIDLNLRDLEWGPLRVVESVDSKYGNVVVTEREGLHDFYETGTLAFTVSDPMYAEETVHIPLLYHAAPRSVLIIGASGSGVISESLKHNSVKRVDFVELDPAIISLAEKYGPPGYMSGDGRSVNAVLGDGRSYVAGTSEKYDVIILAAGAPLSLQVNRLYTAEFFSSARAALLPGGVLGLTVDSPGAYIGPELAGLVSSIENALETVFPNVELLPGETIHLLASDRPLAGGKNRLISGLRQRGIKTAYLNEFYLADRLSPLRAAQLDSVLALYDDGAANSDARPVTFSYALSIWAKHFNTGKYLARGVAALGPGTTVLLLAGLALIVIVAFAIGSRLRPRAAAPLVSLYSTGFTTMFATVLIMLCFQISRGYVYTRLAVIIAAFMVALGLTAILGARKLAALKERPGLILLQAALICLPVIVAAVFRWVQNPGSAAPGPMVDVAYIGLAALAGIIGASVFTSASASLKRSAPAGVDAGAVAYAIDLAGASVAGFTTGFLTVPALGIVNAALAVALVNFLAVGVLQVAIRRSP